MASMVRVSVLTKVFALLALLSVMVPPGALGRSAQQGNRNLPELNIASSISIGRPIFGGKLGPISAGQTLILTCVSDDLHGETLSWWDGDSELESLDVSDEDFNSRNLKLEYLSVGDSGRRLTCRAEKSGASRSVVLEIVERLVILRDATEIVTEDDFIKMSSEETIALSCILQGYSPASVSWWEGETELDAEATGTKYSSSSILTLEGATLGQSVRSFTCKSEGKELPQMVQVQGSLPEVVQHSDDKDSEIESPQSWITIVVIIAICSSVVLVAIRIVAVKIRQCFAWRSIQGNVTCSVFDRVTDVGACVQDTTSHACITEVELDDNK